MRAHRATPDERARLAALEQQAEAFARQLMRQPTPVRERLIVTLEGSTHPDPLRRQFDHYAGALARRLAQEAFHDQGTDPAPR